MQPTNNRYAERIKRTLFGHLLILGTFIGIMWIVEIIDLAIFSGGLDGLGIQPRTLVGLRNIVFSPFLHVGPGHLLANTLPFIVLGWLVMVRRATDFAVVAATAAVVSGVGVWLLGATGTIHVGMSGVIFGFSGLSAGSGLLRAQHSIHHAGGDGRRTLRRHDLWHLYRSSATSPGWAISSA